MKYEKIAEYSNTKFRRITGVKRATFDKMAEILHKGYAQKYQRRGRTPKLSNRRFIVSHTGIFTGIPYLCPYSSQLWKAESNIYRGIKRVEDTLIQGGAFSLPGRKVLLKSDMEYEVILVDATESPIERPQKSKSDMILERKNGTH